MHRARRGRSHQVNGIGVICSPPARQLPLGSPSAIQPATTAPPARWPARTLHRTICSNCNALCSVEQTVAIRAYDALRQPRLDPRLARRRAEKQARLDAQRPTPSLPKHDGALKLFVYGRFPFEVCPVSGTVSFPHQRWPTRRWRVSRVGSSACRQARRLRGGQREQRSMRESGGATALRGDSQCDSGAVIRDDPTIAVVAIVPKSLLFDHVKIYIKQLKNLTYPNTFTVTLSKI